MKEIMYTAIQATEGTHIVKYCGIFVWLLILSGTYYTKSINVKGAPHIWIAPILFQEEHLYSDHSSSYIFTA